MAEAAPRILCVDDEPYLLAALGRTLRGRFAVSTATSSADALRVLRDGGPFAAVVSDLSMPGGDGIELLRQVRAQWPAIARILLSGHEPRRVEAGLEQGLLYRCLGKPFPVEELERALVEAIANPQGEAVRG